MAAIKPPAATVETWLRNNLGKGALAGNTGTDHKALLAAVSIIDLYSYQPDSDLLHAFALVVSQMQEKQRFLAYHAIAHVTDWHYRDRLWDQAGLPPLTKIPRCQFEPAARI